MENSCGKAETNSKDTIRTTKDKAMERCSGLMDPYTEDTGARASKMVSV